MTKSTTHDQRHQGLPASLVRLDRFYSAAPLRVASLLFIFIALLLMLQASAWAQTSTQDASLLDPPGSIARLNLVEGRVDFLPADGNADASTGAVAWTPAHLNRPLTTGDQLWAGPQSRAELHLGSTAVRMNAQTSLDLFTLDDNVTRMRLAQGGVKLRVRNLYPGQRLEVDTPNLAFLISQPGDYRLDVDPAANTTRVVSQSGSGVIYGDNGTSVNLGNQQQVTFGGTNLTPAGLGATSLDAFDNWAMARDQAEDRSVTARYVPRETVGYQQLDSYGDWTQDPNYGAVWLPRAVPDNWAPYRVGHWSWIRPWGWTWIDDAPWGFAPFHYGRWTQIGPRWGWVPGHLEARPVYAPALVAFVGGGSGGVSWNVSIDGGARPALGWFPLAPGEAFRPAYHASPRYVTQVNQNVVINNIVNQTNVTNVANVYRYARTPGAVTAVSAADFARGRPVANNVTLTAADLWRAQLLAPGRGMPQRPESRDVRPATNALPPAAANSRSASNPPAEWRSDGRFNAREGLDRNSSYPARSQALGVVALPAGAAPAQTVAAPAATSPTATPAQGRSAEDAQRRARLDQERQQGATRPAVTSAQPTAESLGQRAFREQAQRNAAPAPAAARPDTQGAPGRNADNSIEQARRAQQQLQRDQERQQRDLVHRQNEQRRQNEESLAQRAQREQAVARQQQVKEQAEATRRVQDQKARQQQSQQQVQTQVHTQIQAQPQAQERQKERVDVQREPREARQAREQQQRQRRDAP